MLNQMWSQSIPFYAIYDNEWQTQRHQKYDSLMYVMMYNTDK